MNSLDTQILLTLANKGMLTRNELVEVLEVPRTTLYGHLIQLEKRGFVDKVRASSSGAPGRPKEFWQFTKNKVMEE